ncbi:tRNA pseudouridine synthase C [Corynebacterium kalinowskii]|uniref:RNA pseudouridylate synthase n=1 Tax=Corynebacterium kalinowskii TaxID=2675216 RepID=A0A6B8VLT0_9CORY|nr:tRNA pseudouridine synthase C [Corynebacterium kalinowskii]
MYEGHGLLVVDKPPFLPSTPNGRLVRNTVQTRIRVQRGNDDIVAAHRLDRLTSGLLALSTLPESRGFYQQQFAQRHVRKRYRAQVSAPLDLSEKWRTIVLPMLKVKGERQVRVDKRGKPTVTRARLIDERLLELEPHTGHTHQLRVLCAHLGAPIVGDDTYPVDVGLQLDNYSTELKLCATELELRLWRSGELAMWSSPRLAEAGFWGSAE